MKNLNKSQLYIGYIFLIILGISFQLSCKKQDDWLNVKRNISDVTPNSLQDFQAILDNTQVMNGYSSIIGLVGTDNIYLPDANLDSADPVSRNAYLWAKDIYQGESGADWFFCYQMIEYCNIVLDGLKNLNSKNQKTQYNSIKGSALFYRSFAFYELAQLYCKPFALSSSESDLGIPLRVSSDVNIKYPRSSVTQTYDQIITDLNTAITLLPQKVSYKTRPSSMAGTALLSKVYLTMGDYSNALINANLTLNNNSTLLDYNSIPITTGNPFPSLAKGHPEVIFHAWSWGNGTAYPNGKARVSPFLYNTYEAGDLRRTAFFTADGSTGYYRFKGTYSSNPYNFCGIATDEIYLIRSECYTRLGRINDALTDLNKLLKNRYTTQTYNPLNFSDPQLLLKRVILERQKEMPFTGNLRWEDLRRINMDPHLQQILTRVNHNLTYSLEPNDSRYVYPLPDDEIQINNLVQNIR